MSAGRAGGNPLDNNAIPYRPPRWLCFNLAKRLLMLLILLLVLGTSLTAIRQDVAKRGVTSGRFRTYIVLCVSLHSSAMITVAGAASD